MRAPGAGFEPAYLVPVWAFTVSRSSSCSFPDAEPLEDAVEDVVGHDSADDLAQLVESQPQIECDQLFSAAVAEGPGCRAQRDLGTHEAVPAARAGAGGQ